MKVSEIITSISAKMPNSLANQDMLDFINDVEAQLYNETIKDFVTTIIPTVAGQAEYDFPANVTILDIEALLLDNVELPKRDVRQGNRAGYYGDGGKLTLSPVPSSANTSIKVISRLKPTVKLIADISADDLLLPSAYIDIYRYYAYAQISFLREQFDRGNSWLMQFNTRMNDYKMWYNNNKPRMFVKYNRRW